MLAPETAITDSVGSLLNPRGINAIRDFPGRGTLVWGARTLRGSDAEADEYKYVAVRRLHLHLQRSIEEGIAWAAFEPNGEQLWARLRLVVGNFLVQLWREGAFVGSRPQDAFVVKCDTSTMTAADLADGVVTVLVGFAPLRPAEFVTFVVRQRLA